MLAAKADEDAAAQKNLEKNNRKVHADDNISFEQLLPRNELGGLEDVFESSLSRAIVGSSQRQGLDLGDTKLNKVTQLTGFSDPVYAEAYVNVNQYDIVLDVFILNQTADTLQNCTLELATLGDLKLVDKPFPIVLSPGKSATMKASVKVFFLILLHYYVRAKKSLTRLLRLRTASFSVTLFTTLPVPPQTEMSSYSMISTSTLWITSCLLVVQMQSSAKCGPTLNGKTRLQ